MSPESYLFITLANNNNNTEGSLHEVSKMSNQTWSCIQAGRRHARGAHARGMEEGKGKDFQLHS